ncbi:MAG: hypothetical protein WAZ98_01500 [Cyclobacteriaceae bacterium]
MGLLVIFLFLLAPLSYGQNTKGDKSEVQRGSKRENRFRPSKKKNKTKPSYNPRVQGRRPTQANRASSKPSKVYSQKRVQSNTAKTSRQNIRSSSTRISPRSATGQTRNVYPQRGRYVNNPSKKPRSVEHATSNRKQLAYTKRISHKPDSPKRRRVVPNSASRSYVSRRSINAFAGFWNKKPKEEKAYIGDISGRRLRTKNFETKRPVLVNPTTRPYKPKRRVGDRPYKGPAAGSHISVSSSGKAWRGDVAGRKIRGRNFTSKKSTEQAGSGIHLARRSKPRVGDRPYKGTVPGGGYQSVSGKRKKGTGPVPVRTPGIGAKGIGYSGNIKGQRPMKGGGSISGKRWNNKGMPISVRTPAAGADRAATYQGNIRGRGKVFAAQGADYSGNIKATKPLKGGGSISGRRWNNKGIPISVRTPAAGADRAATYQGNIRGRGKVFTAQGADYSGNIKATKPVKGGGSISGKMWNNKGQPTTVRIPSGDEALFQGNIKRGRPVKGGGSVSGKMWNNKETPIPARVPPAGAEKIGRYTGGYRLFDLRPSMRNQGEEFTGTMKAKKPAKGGGSVSGKLWNNNEQPIQVKIPGEKSGKAASYRGKIKIGRGEYVKNPNAADEALKKNKPDKTTYLVDDLQIKVKQQDYKTRPNAAKGSMPGIAPGKNSMKASEFTNAMRQNWSYKHNPSSADEALDQHAPGKAFARVTDYQGNIKMKKFKFFDKKDLHPDAAFVKIEKNNTDEERSVLTNFKLWWARLFKKSDTQPDHLKEKYRKPRYDKREEGLWYD